MSFIACREAKKMEIVTTKDAGLFAGSGKGKDFGEEVLELEKESSKSGKWTGS